MMDPATNTDTNAESGCQAAAKPTSPVSVRSLFVATTVFACLLRIGGPFGRGVFLSVIVLPAIILPPYFILRFDRQPWQFSIRSLLVLIAVYALLLGLASQSFETFWQELYRVEILWIVCFYPFLVCYIFIRRGWYGSLLALFGVVGLLASLAFVLVLLWGQAMSGFGVHQNGPSSTTQAFLLTGIIVSIILIGCGALLANLKLAKEQAEQVWQMSLIDALTTNTLIVG